MQAILEVTNLIENTNPLLEQSHEADSIKPGDGLQTLAPVELAYVGGGTGGIAIF
jgi:hypothetical protein